MHNVYKFSIFFTQFAEYHLHLEVIQQSFYLWAIPIQHILAKRQSNHALY